MRIINSDYYHLINQGDKIATTLDLHNRIICNHQLKKERPLNHIYSLFSVVLVEQHILSLQFLSTLL
jgi:hypothetical protein